MNTKIKNKILIILVATIASLIPAIMFGKWIEAIFFLIAHTCIRPQFDREYHHIIPSVCREITANILFWGITFTLPLEISLLFAIPINYLIGWVGCLKASSDYYERKCNEYKEKYAEPNNDLLHKCKLAKLSKRDTEIAKLYFIDNWKPKEIWLWLLENKEYENIEWDSMYILLWRITQKLNKIK